MNIKMNPQKSSGDYQHRNLDSLSQQYQKSTHGANTDNQHPPETIDKAVHALTFIDPNQLSRLERAQIATAIKNEFGGNASDTFFNWIMSLDGYNKAKYKGVWANAHKYQTGIKTLYFHARNNGYKEESVKLTPADRQRIEAENQARAKRIAADKARRLAESERTAELLGDNLTTLFYRAPSANRYTNDYANKKKLDGCGAYSVDRKHINSQLSRVYPFSRIKEPSLVIPLQNEAGQIVNAQVITRDYKHAIKGISTRGFFAFIGEAPLPSTTDDIIIAEGYATAASLKQSLPEKTVVMAVDAGNLKGVGGIMRRRFPHSNIVIAGDNDLGGEGEKAALNAAVECGGVCKIPKSLKGKKTDFNDVLVKHGAGVIRYMLSHDFDVDINPEKLEVRINKRYLDRSVSTATEALGVKFMIIQSEKGTGKTTEMVDLTKKYQRGNSLLGLELAPRKRLLKSLGEDLSHKLGQKVYYYEDVKNESDLIKKAEMLKSMVCTLDSLPALLKDHPEIAFDTVFFDESETMANMLVSDVTGNKTWILKTLKRVCEQAGKVFMMDADAGGITDYFMRIIADGEKVGKLINESTPWDDHEFIEITTDAEKKAKEIKQNATYKLVLDYLRKGRRPYFASATKKSCEDLLNAIKENFSIDAKIKEKVISLTGDNDGKEASDLLKDTGSCVIYELIIASPAVSVGVSFDAKNHFHVAIGDFTSNNNGTGSVNDMLQALARVRNLICKQWFVALPNGFAVTDAGIRPKDIREDIERIRAYNMDFIKCPIPIEDTAEHQIGSLYDMCEAFRRSVKADFRNIALSRVGEMGMKISSISAESIEGHKYDDASLAIAKLKVKDTKKVLEQTGCLLNDEQYLLFKQESKKVSVAADKAYVEALEADGIVKKDRVETDRQIINAITNNDPLPCINTSDKKELKKARQDGNKAASAERKTVMVIAEEAGVIPTGGKTLTASEYEKVKANLRFNNEVMDEDKHAMARHRIERDLCASFSDMKGDLIATNQQVGMHGSDAMGAARQREIQQAPLSFDKLYLRSLMAGYGENKSMKVFSHDEKLHYMIKKKMFKYAVNQIDKPFTNKSLKRSGFHRFLKKHKDLTPIKNKLKGVKDWENKLGMLMKDLIKGLGYGVRSKKLNAKGNRGKIQWKSYEIDYVEAYYQRRQERGLNFVDNMSYIISKYNGIVGYVLSREEVRRYKITERDILVISQLFVEHNKKDHKQIASDFKAMIEDKGLNYATSEIFNKWDVLGVMPYYWSESAGNDFDAMPARQPVKEFSAYGDLINILPSELEVAYIQPPHVVAILRAFDSVPKSQARSTANKFISTAKRKGIETAINDLVSYSNKIKKIA